jgi:hypothetical protein
MFSVAEVRAWLERQGDTLARTSSFTARGQAGVPERTDAEVYVSVVESLEPRARVQAFVACDNLLGSALRAISRVQRRASSQASDTDL